MFISIVFLLKSTMVHPLKNNPSFAGAHDLCDWLKKNTSPKNTMVFIYDKDMGKVTDLSAAIKCFGHRSTFIDRSFPFNESSIIEWDERIKFINSFDVNAGQLIDKLKDKYYITHILITKKNKNRFKAWEIAWENDHLILIDIKSVF